MNNIKEYFLKLLLTLLAVVALIVLCCTFIGLGILALIASPILAYYAKRDGINIKIGRFKIFDIDTN